MLQSSEIARQLVHIRVSQLHAQADADRVVATQRRRRTIDARVPARGRGRRMLLRLVAIR